MAREEIYREQLQELGIYEKAFEPEIKTLANLERDLTRAQKAWKNTAPRGAQPSMLNPLYGLVCRLRQEILIHREALGLTPKALRRLRGQAGSDGPSQKDLMNTLLSGIAERVSAYDEGVSKPDTGEARDG